MQTNAPTRQEVRAAIERGLAFLQKAQNSNGWWSTPDQPAVTALVLTAMNLEPTHRFQRNRTSEMNRGFDYLLSCVKPDGSIQKAGLANYNTSLSLMALTSAADTNFLPVILKAREFIASTQIDMGVKGTNDTPFDGGVGYGSKYDHSDMNNTLTAIEAMRVSEALLPERCSRVRRASAGLGLEGGGAFPPELPELARHEHCGLGVERPEGSWWLRVLPWP